MHRFLPGILLIQFITLVFTFIHFSADTLLDNTDESDAGLAALIDTAFMLRVMIPCLLVGLLSAFWFSSVAHRGNERALARLQRSHAKDREKIRLRAEKDKLSVATNSARELRRETTRVNRRANTKVGLSMLGVAGAGVLLLITELVTLGMMTLTAASGAVGGYIWRGKGHTTSTVVLNPGGQPDSGAAASDGSEFETVVIESDSAPQSLSKQNQMDNSVALSKGKPDTQSNRLLKRLTPRS